MPPSDEQLLTLVTTMESRNGVLRRRDHPGYRPVLEYLERQGAIVRVHPGVFVDVRHASTRGTRYAAALARLPRAVLWGGSAAAALLGELTGDLAPGERVQVALPFSVKPISGIDAVHRRVPARFVRRLGVLRCPTPAYVAVAAAAEDDGALTERFLRAGIVQAAELAAVLDAFRAHPGQAARRRVVAASADNPWSGGERELHALLRRHCIGGWVANVELVVDGRRCFPDVLFEQERLVVEFDGYQVHSRPGPFETDRIRQNALVLAGYRVPRFTWKRLTTDEAGVLAELRQALTRQITPTLGVVPAAERGHTPSSE